MPTLIKRTKTDFEIKGKLLSKQTKARKQLIWAKIEALLFIEYKHDHLLFVHLFNISRAQNKVYWYVCINRYLLHCICLNDHWDGTFTIYDTNVS